jgi:sec-independent protein translocase protein TatA
MDGWTAERLVLIMGLGVQEMLLIFLAIVFLFGAKKIPEIARGLGKGIKEFKRGAEESDDEEQEKNTEKEVVRKRKPKTDLPDPDGNPE